MRRHQQHDGPSPHINLHIIFNASILSPKSRGTLRTRVVRSLPTKGELMTWAGEHNRRCQQAYQAACALISDPEIRAQLELHLGDLRLGAMGVGLIQGDLSEGRFR